MRHHPVFDRFKPWQGEVDQGLTANFLGVFTRDSFFNMMEKHPQLRFETSRLPAFSEEYFEWIDLLEAVTAARGQFTMIELGSGWGRWLVNGWAAAKAVHGEIPCRLIGVEPEPTHFRWMHVHLQDNGVDRSRCQLVQAAVTEYDGAVWFYVGRPADWYGQAVAPTPGRLRRLWALLRKEVSVGDYRVRRVKAVSLRTLLRQLETVDLIDLDVQGAELSVLKAAVDELNRKVKRVHIGTHSPEIESGLRTLFSDHGWNNVNDYPSGSDSNTPWGSVKFQDGVQTWTNPKLA
jgi:FkbM family methyltransferase